jgi:ABC-type dipeptide/oligopeptide/nickel transport system ATPase component
MILQDPQTSLNPVFNIGNQLMESLALTHKERRRNLVQRAVDSLRNVSVAAPERRM